MASGALQRVRIGKGAVGITNRSIEAVAKGRRMALMTSR
jgi:hypothetical protein